jgi:hypothetical protein
LTPYPLRNLGRADKTMRSAPSLRRRCTRAVLALRHAWHRELILQSRIFDPGWYAAVVPDVAEQGWDPALHYIVHGAFAGLRPHPLFDPAWYRNGRSLGDVDPLIHYIRSAASGLDDPSPYFDSAWLRSRGLSVRPGQSALAAWLALEPAIRPAPFPAFDAAWYLAAYPDVGVAGVDPLMHFVSTGSMEGRSPGPLFDAGFYRMANPECRAEGMSPWAHFRRVGAALGRAPHRAFDPAWYASRAGAPHALANLLAVYAVQGRDGWHSTHPTLAPPGSSRAGWEDLPWQGTAPPPGGRTILAVLLDGSDAFAGLVADLRQLPDVDLRLATLGADPALADVPGIRIDGQPGQADPWTVFERAIRALRLAAPEALLVAESLPERSRAVLAETGMSVARDPLTPQTIAAALPPSTGNLAVSAIIPAFNHARFLDERIASVLGQSRLPSEVILLDDASTDETAEIARRWAARSEIPFRVILNDVNSGSTFRQWQKGLDLATGDLVWFAESDDASAEQFLERLVPVFADPLVVLAYAESVVVGVGGEWLSDSYRFYTDLIDQKRWERGYVADGKDEIETALGIKNTIPNASAALFRHKALLPHVAKFATLRYCGDWAAYLAVLGSGRIAYHAEALNRHRQHAGSVTAEGVGGNGQAWEASELRAGLRRQGLVSPRTALFGVLQGQVEALSRGLKPAPAYLDASGEDDLRAALAQHRDEAIAFVARQVDADVNCDDSQRQYRREAIMAAVAGLVSPARS